MLTDISHYMLTFYLMFYNVVTCMTLLKLELSELASLWKNHTGNIQLIVIKIIRAVTTYK